MRAHLGIERLAAFAMALLFCLVPATASAHLANFGSWELTREYLGELFPRATEFKAKKDRYSEQEVLELEEALGFELYPEDKTPTFYIANAGEEFLGVAIFIDPRVKPKVLDGAVVTLEVGIGVGPKGAIERVRIYDYRGDLALTRPAFLEQFRGRTLDSSFEMGVNGLEPVAGEEEESRLVARAAREALLLMEKTFSPDRSQTPVERSERPTTGCATTPGAAPGVWLPLMLVLWRRRCRSR